MRLAMLPLALVMLSVALPKTISIHARDSLSLRQGTYASVLFVAEPARTPDSNLPLQYRFTESGVTPPGMKFETYPCNKPGRIVCSQLAISNGIFLDGTPTETGSYTFVITAADAAERASQQFTVIVNPSDQRK
jgi:Putative Ig domain